MITLSINGKNRSLEDWDIGTASLSFNSWAEDTLTFTTGAPLDPLPDLWAIVEVFADGIRIFKGTLSQLPIELGSASRQYTYTAVGPWWGLSRLQWQQSWRLVRARTGLGIFAIYHRECCQIFGLHGDFNNDSTQIYLNADHVMALHSVGFTLDNAFLFASESLAENERWKFSATRITAYSDAVIRNGTTLGGFTNANSFRETLGGPEPYPVPPYEEKTLATVGDVLASCYKWMPDLISKFDYSPVTPFLSIVPGRTLAEETVNISDFESISLSPFSDVKPTGVVLIKIVPAQITQGGFYATYKISSAFTSPSAPVDRTDPLALVIPYEVDDANQNPGDLTAIAESLWDAVKLDSLQGSLSFYDESAITRYLGKKLIFDTPGVPSIPAIVQTETLDLFSMVRSLTFGSTRSLSSLDRIDQYKYLFSKSRGKSAWTGS